ncbi:hypothetical protein Q9L42_020765 (plasmid) [Methylomarinum sp. Ch1-1]|uniref:Uncharacterized protein n=1 Tax=Methylomarinum roseum TaxID=3067653 RepID=A0AAU7P0G9_9GAMM|nr:hypothetical protein [Methylomarinum sp. Ch1-1]MDP4518952.1 hypothetical protein [Methylomarinum sp. Ch1-1]MDP4523352.1 hypothetical protein [Methylomarinum sp. Ch1-1]
MFHHQVRTPEHALLYLVDCTLATVSSMAMLKSRKKNEFNRQIGIAQKGINWIQDMKIDPFQTRAEDVINQFDSSVEKWSAQYLPKN